MRPIRNAILTREGHTEVRKLQEDTANCSSGENSELSVKQQQLIAALIAGHTIVVAAKVAGISERTAHNWLKQPAFYQAYGQAKQTVFDASLEDVKLIREMLVKHINAEVEITPTSQIQAAKVLLEQYIVAGEIAQIKEQLQELQGKLQSFGVDL